MVNHDCLNFDYQIGKMVKMWLNEAKQTIIMMTITISI